MRYNPNARLVQEKRNSGNRRDRYRVLTPFEFRGELEWNSHGKFYSEEQISDWRERFCDLDIFYEDGVEAKIDSAEEMRARKCGERKVLFEIILANLYYSDICANREFLN